MGQAQTSNSLPTPTMWWNIMCIINSECPLMSTPILSTLGMQLGKALLTLLSDTQCCQTQWSMCSITLKSHGQLSWTQPSLFKPICSLKAFINDVVITAASDCTTNMHQLLQCTQAQLLWWDQLVKVMGGALNPQKCCCLAYIWQPIHHDILCLAPLDTIITLISIPRSNSHTPIPVTLSKKAHDIWAFDLNESWITTPLETHLWQKAIMYVMAFQQTPMDCREAVVLYCSCFLPALTYPLPVTWLPDGFFDIVQ